jgi:hypothetical protein
MDKNLHLSNINGHKKLNLLEVEEIHCCFRGMKLNSETLGHALRIESILESMKQRAVKNPDKLPEDLQVIEWELSQVVQNAAALLKDAGTAIEKCHALRGGNETLVKLIKEREELLGEL